MNIAHKNKNFFNKKYYLYILIVLSSLTFYNPFGIISTQTGKFIFYFICLLSLFYAYKNGINLQKVKYPRTAYKMLIIGILLSTLMAVAFQSQSLYITIIATLPYLLGYSVFYTLMKFNIPKEKIEHAIWIFCFIGMGTYIINIITFPNMIFGVEKDEYDMSRGIIRIGVYSLELIVLFFFYSINQWIVTKKKKYIWVILLTAVFIVLSVTRQYILLSIALSLIFILKKASLSNKIITISFCLLFYFIILPQIPIYKTMVELSETQAEKNKYEEEDIRIQAWNFYTNEYQTNEFTRIFGNSIPSIGNSKWGNSFEKTVSAEYGGNRCFFVDVGWAGFYWLFGAFATFGLFFLLLKAILKNKSTNKQYLTYWCIFITITSFASAPIIFYHQIISITTILYLIYGKEENDSSNNFKLQ